MRFKTVEELEEHIAAHNELLDAAVPLLSYLAKLEGDQYGFDRDDIEIGDFGLSATWEEYFCGDTEYNRVHIDFEDLFNPDYEADLKARYEENLKEARQKAIEAEKKREQKKQEARKRQYEKLKKEFGEEG